MVSTNVFPSVILSADIVVKDKLPEPSVFNTCPAEPSVTARCEMVTVFAGICPAPIVNVECN